MLTIKNYVRAKSLEEAYELNQKRRNRIIGGMMWLKMSRLSIDTAIDLCDLGLDKIEESEDKFRIGAMVTLRQLELHEGLRAYTGGEISKVVSSIVGVQFRNGATVGGSVFGRYGFSDVLTFLLSADTCVELYRGGIVPLEDFVNRAYDRDILVSVIIKKRKAKFCYLTVRNAKTDFPVLACSLAKIDGEFRLSIGARPSRAMLVKDEKGLLLGAVDEKSAEVFADYAAEVVPTSKNLRASAEYRTHLVRVLTKRALLEIGGENNGN